jgi:protein ImuB
MRRVASLYLPALAIERLRRKERPFALRPEPRAPSLPVDDDPGACSVPRRGGWRPGARWAQDGAAERANRDLEIASLPAHRQPPMRELGRRSEAADHPFKPKRVEPPAASGRAADGDAPATGPLVDGPIVLTAHAGRQVLITAASPSAMALGLMPGMPATQARALVPDLDVRSADPEGDQRFLHELALYAVRRWTPGASVSGDDGLWLDLTGTTHLFGGERRFCERVVRLLARLGYTARIAIAGTPGAAHARARYGHAQVDVTPRGGEAQAIARLPLAALRLEAGALAAAKRFGFDRIGDLLSMPRGPLARRLGAAAVERLDQAIGRVAEPLTPVVDVEMRVAERRLLEPILTAEPIAQVVGDVVDDLMRSMREIGHGVRALRLVCQKVDGTDAVLAIGTSSATRDGAHLRRLLSLKLDRIDPGMGIEVVRLEAVRTEPLAPSPMREMLAERRRGDVATLVDQLAGRVGSAALFKMGAVESDVPERSVERLGALTVPTGWPAWPRPIRMLPRPEQLHDVLALLPDHAPRRFSWRGDRHNVVAGDGPERIHGEWWVRKAETWAVRDYFKVEDETGERFWIFRRGDGVDGDTGDLSWYMHGLFG